MRADWRNDDCLHGRVHDRPARGKRIGCRARWGGNNQAVSAVTTHKFPVDGELELDHARYRALIDHGVVQHVLVLNDGSCTFQLDVEHDAVTHRRTPGECLLEGRVEFCERKTRKKTQTAQVYRQDGNSARRSHSRSGEQRAISPQHKKDLRLLRYFLARHCVGRRWQGTGGFLVVQNPNAPGLEPLQERWRDCGKVRAARAGNNADRLKGLNWLHVRLRFYSSASLRAWRKYS